MKKLTILLMAAATLLPASVDAQRIQQKLGRGVVAVTDPSRQEVLVTWRKLAQDGDGVTYNLYRRSQGTADYIRVNTDPISATCLQTTKAAVPYDSELAVSIVKDGVESVKSEPFLFRRQAYKDVFFDIDFETTLLNPDDYRVKYAWPMDTDGSGEIDAILVDRLYAGETVPAASPDGAGTSHKLQAYSLDGTCLWTIDMGPNIDICAGQNDMVTAYDIDCDGRCDVLIKSSDGTRFWDAAAGTWGLYANGSATADTDGDGIVDYRSQSRRNPPFYVSVVDGRTGAEKACSELRYAEVTDGTDSYSRDNRADYMDDAYGTEYAFMTGHFAICYFDGIHPSLAMECLDRTRSDKSHHNYVFVWSYDWTGGRPSGWHHSYTWSRNDKTPWPAEFHQLRVADVDGDGIDEMLEGGFGVNPVKGMVFSAGIGHGDRFDVSDLDPDRPGMEVFAIQQSELLGQVLYDAATGEHIKEWYLPSVYDVARGRCMDVDGGVKGCEVFSLLPNLYDCKGNVISEGTTTYPQEGSWWDADLQRELIGSPGGSGYGTNVMIQKYDGTRLIEFSKQSDWAVHSGWANRPAFMGDIIGDWREEIILMKQTAESSTGIIGYSTDIATGHSIYTLQEDPHYRLDCTTRGYYQMPCTGFYLGGDMPAPPLPPVMTADLRWQSGGIWTSGGQGFTTFDGTAAAGYADGRSVLFDISGDNTSDVVISGTLRPQSVYVMSPKGHDYTFSGTGELAGEMSLYKSMQGTATFNTGLTYTGQTVISEGTLSVNGRIAGPVMLMARGTLGGNAVIGGEVSFEGALNYEGCRLMPSGTDGVLTFSRSLTLPGNVYVEVSADAVTAGRCGRITVEGDLTLKGENTFTVNHSGIVEGEYVLAECTGVLTADAGSIKVRGLNGLNYDIRVDGRTIILAVNATRAPQQNVTWTGAESGAWDYKAQNFTVDGTATSFVMDDEVVFDGRSQVRDITVDEMMMAGGVTFNVDEGVLTMTGLGGIGGTAGVTKNGTGEVRMALDNSSYTGPTVINGGTLTVTSMFDGGQNSAIGASPAAEGNLCIGRGVLKIDADNMGTDRIVTLNDTATITVANASGSLSLKGKVGGAGWLVKDGPGQLNFTYGGINPFMGLILRGGTVAQGTWNSTFGRSGSPMVLAGGAVHLIDMNNSSTRPVFDYAVTVEEGTSNTVKGTTRGAINGSFKGAGDLTVVSSGVRNDIGADFSAFSGCLRAEGANFRLMDNVRDMSHTDIVMSDGCRMSHYKSNSGNTSAVTTSIGSLASKAADCELGNGADSYEVGCNGADVTFAGVLKAKSVTKCGSGTWTLSGGGSTSPVTVEAGTVQLYNSPLASSPSAFSTGLLTIKAGATLTGTGCAGNVTVNKGGTVAAGYRGGTGTLKATGRVTMQAGSRMEVKVRVNSSGSAVNDKFKFSGTLTHDADTIIIVVDDNRGLAEGDELSIFTGTASMTGSYILKTVSGNRTIAWDDSELLTRGILRVASVTSGIGHVTAGEAPVDVYSADGVILRRGVRAAGALDGLPRGIYIVGGRKVVND